MLVWKTWLLLLLPGLAWSWCQDRGAKCFEDEFQCKSGICIDGSYRCDGENDCGDKSDEADCDKEYEIKCRRSDVFMCDGECWPIWLKCDDKTDCFDELDEAFCGKPLSESTTTTTTTTTERTTLATTRPVCTEGQFQCNSGKCIAIEFRCDGESDCNDYTDEDNCEQEYNNRCKGAEFFMCDSECFPRHLQCNGLSDCIDGLDEAFCEAPSTMEPYRSFEETSPFFSDLFYDIDVESEPKYDQDVAASSQAALYAYSPIEEVSVGRAVMPIHSAAPTSDYVEQETDQEKVGVVTVKLLELQSNITAMGHTETDESNTTEEREPDIEAGEDDIPSYEAGSEPQPPTYIYQYHTEQPTDAPTLGYTFIQQSSTRNLDKRIPATFEDPNTIKQHIEWELHTEKTPSQEIETLFMLLKNTPQSAIQTPSSTLPKALVEKAKAILREDPEALIVILDQLGTDLPSLEDKQVAELSYTGKSPAEDWIPLSMAQKVTHTQNDTLLESALDLIYSLWEVAKGSTPPLLPPMEENDGKQDVIAILFKLFETDGTRTEDVKQTTKLQEEDDSTSAPIGDFSSESTIDNLVTSYHPEAENLLEEDDATTQAMLSTVSMDLNVQDVPDDYVTTALADALTDKTIEDPQYFRAKLSVELESGQAAIPIFKTETEEYNDITNVYSNNKALKTTHTPPQTTKLAKTRPRTLSSTRYFSQSTQTTEMTSTQTSDCKGTGCELSEEENSLDVMPSPDDSEDVEDEQDVDIKEPEMREYDDNDDISTTEAEENTSPSPDLTSTHIPKICAGPGPIIYAVDHHFCFKGKPFYPISSYIKLHPNSDMESIHVYLVALQLTGGDMAVLRLDPTLLRKIGTKKLADIVRVATKMNIPLLFEVHVADMTKMKEQLTALSKTVKEQNGLILGWNLQMNNRAAWTVSKRGKAKNPCVNETLSLENIIKFRENVKDFGHLFTLTVIEDEPNFPILKNTKKFDPKKCEYNPERWTEMSAEFSNFHVLDPNRKFSKALVSTKYVPLLLRSAHVPSNDTSTGKIPVEYGYGGFIVNAETTVASYLLLRKFRNFIPDV